MSRPPKTYRVYCFDLGQKSVTAEFVTAVHDEEAIAAAKESCSADKCEIWEGRRLVAQLEYDARRCVNNERSTGSDFNSGVLRAS